ncbi:MAG: HAD family hydrolase [archaeon]
MITTILLDSDGTLYDEKSAKTVAEKDVSTYIAQASGISFGEVHNAYLSSKKTVLASYQDTPERNDRELWYRELLSHLDLLDLKDLSPKDLCSMYWDIVLENIKPYEDVIKILPELSEKYDLWVLTDESQDIQIRKLTKLGIHGYLKGVISSDQTGHLKPRKSVFEYALNQTGSKKESTAMIGDNPKRDIRGANNTGLVSIFIRRGKYSDDHLEGDNRPNYIIDDYSELLSVLSKI